MLSHSWTYWILRFFVYVLYWFWIKQTFNSWRYYFLWFWVHPNPFFTQLQHSYALCTSLLYICVFRKISVACLSFCLLLEKNGIYKTPFCVLVSQTIMFKRQADFKSEIIRNRIVVFYNLRGQISIPGINQVKSDHFNPHWLWIKPLFYLTTAGSFSASWSKIWLQGESE